MTLPDSPIDHSTPDEAPAESPAFPKFLRIVAAVIMFDLVVWSIWMWPRFRDADWTTSGLVLWGAAAVMMLWVGWWIVRSRTRLHEGELSQTWIWNKRVRTNDVAQLKLVHLPWLERIMAPRLLVRRRNGTTLWFHSADARLLSNFAEQVATPSAFMARKD
ncbi:hypothetical protein [Ottowia thiooxydans]|uniref:hypothetical protein n=1 Tax=Ottowia thiooxydans TaxID=219182 RepID=UPI0003F59CED|nr:hypothetical protein [Ottowia thiooxydans]